MTGKRSHHLFERVSRVEQGVDRTCAVAFDETPGCLRDRPDPPRCELHAEAGSHHVFQFVRLVEDNHVVLW